MNLIKGGKPITPTGDPTTNGDLLGNGQAAHENGDATVVDGAQKVEVRDQGIDSMINRVVIKVVSLSGCPTERVENTSEGGQRRRGEQWQRECSSRCNDDDIITSDASRSWTTVGEPRDN